MQRRRQKKWPEFPFFLLWGQSICFVCWMPFFCFVSFGTHGICLAPSSLSARQSKRRRRSAFRRRPTALQFDQGQRTDSTISKSTTTSIGDNRVDLLPKWRAFRQSQRLAKSIDPDAYIDSYQRTRYLGVEGFDDGQRLRHRVDEDVDGQVVDDDAEGVAAEPVDEVGRLAVLRVLVQQQNFLPKTTQSQHRKSRQTWLQTKGFA